MLSICKIEKFTAQADGLNVAPAVTSDAKPSPKI